MADEAKLYKVEIELTEPLLGTVPTDHEVHEKIVMEKNPDGIDPAEADLIPPANEESKPMTGFRRDSNGNPIMLDYAIKGYFKDACSMLSRISGTKSSGLRAHRKVIDGLIFVAPRYIPIKLAGEITVLERPLRAQTQQGERVALMRSETIPAGSKMTLYILALGVVTEEILREWLDYGALRGIGQWRNAGYGRFRYECSLVASGDEAKQVYATLA